MGSRKRQNKGNYVTLRFRHNSFYFFFTSIQLIVKQNMLGYIIHLLFYLSNIQHNISQWMSWCSNNELLRWNNVPLRLRHRSVFFTYSICVTISRTIEYCTTYALLYIYYILKQICAFSVPMNIWKRKL